METNATITLGAGGIMDSTALVNISSESFSCLDTDMLSYTTVTDILAWTISPSVNSKHVGVAIALLVFFLFTLIMNGYVVGYFMIKLFHVVRPASRHSKTVRKKFRETGIVGVFQSISAICDLLASVTAILLTSVTILMDTFLLFGSNDVALCKSCDVEGFFVIFTSSLSLHFHAAYTVSRSVCVFSDPHPLGWRAGHNKHERCAFAMHIIFAPLLITLWSCFVAILPIALGFGQYIFNTHIGICIPTLDGLSNSDVPNIYYSLFLIFVALIPLLIRIIANVTLVRKIYKIKKMQMKNEITSRFTIFGQYLCFFTLPIFGPVILSWTPAVICFVIAVSGTPATLIPNDFFIFVWIMFVSEYFLFSAGEGFFAQRLVSLTLKDMTTKWRPKKKLSLLHYTSRNWTLPRVRSQNH